jgi:hypothetical protein
MATYVATTRGLASGSFGGLLVRLQVTATAWEKAADLKARSALR